MIRLSECALQCIGSAFGIPDANGIKDFGDRIWQRSREQEKALAYVNGVIDRIINKARGILPFNSLILAIIAIIYRSNPGWFIVALSLLAGFLLSASSLILLLTMFWPHFGKMEEYSSYQAEFDSTVLIIRKRALALVCATLLSCIGFLSAAFAILGRIVS